MVATRWWTFLREFVGSGDAEWYCRISANSADQCTVWNSVQEEACRKITSMSCLLLPYLIFCYFAFCAFKRVPMIARINR